MDRYVVVGNPIEHSRSPQIHAAFARQTGQSLIYGRLLAPLDGFERTLQTFFDEGGAGANVTLPFKARAFAWVDERDPFAATAGAVNTIVPGKSGLRGCNTDGIGLVRDLERNIGVDLGNARILISGAGGAVQGVVGPLLGRAPACIDVTNRTASRAVTLIERLEDPRLRALAVEEITGPYDVVINGSSAGLAGERPDLPRSVVRDALVYDMAYGAAAVPFLEWAQKSGARRIADGLGMLVEQAAEAFYLWRGVRPETDSVITSMRNA